MMVMLGFSDYIQALESERCKILVFSKELPLSLELVTQAIEACRIQLCGKTTSSEKQNLNGQSECSGQTSSEGPVLEEFIPIKKRASSDFGGDDEQDEQHSRQPKIVKDDDNNNNNNTDKRKSDWLRSVQLWNPQSPLKEDIPRKTLSVLEVNRDGGAFQPFHKEATALTTTPNKASSTPAPTPPVAGGNKKEEKEGHNNYNSKRKQRRCWSQELHKRFLNALHHLGGADCATPKQIRELMKIDGLTNDEVKSHLQKFRLHTKRSSLLIQNNGDLQTTPFVIVGNFIVQPPEHAVASTTALPGIYAPVASHAAAAVPTKGEDKKMDLRNSCERSNSEDSEVADHSNSPTSSSCRQI